MKKFGIYLAAIALVAIGARNCVGSGEDRELGRAISQGQTAIVAELLAKGADPKGRAVSLPHLYNAVNHEHVEITRLLLDSGADINLRFGPAKRSPLHEAVKLANLDIIKLLVERGADINIRNTHDRSPLYYARNMIPDRINANRKEDVIEYLLENGATE